MDNKLNLSALTLKNYKNLVADRIGLNNLNVFIGPNGSGKSNFIAVLQFLKEYLSSTPDKSRGITSFEDAIEELGGARILDKTVIPPATVDLFFTFSLKRKIPFEIQIMIKGMIENPIIKSESLSLRSVKVRRQIIDAVSGWQFYNANYINVRSIRFSEPKIGPGDMFIFSSGKNLPLVLDNLIQKDFEFEERINNAMKQILPQTRKIRPIRSGRLSLTVEWYFDGMKEPFYLDEMSDGTVRMLCWAVILHSPVPPSLLVIDEPEMGIHPAWLPVLAEWIKSASERTQIIVSTHSPDLLDHFTDRTEDVICFRFDGKSHFTPEHLSKEKLSAMFDEGWELGDLYRVGDPGVGGWPW